MLNHKIVPSAFSYHRLAFIQLGRGSAKRRHASYAFPQVARAATARMA